MVTSSPSRAAMISMLVTVLVIVAGSTSPSITMEDVPTCNRSSIMITGSSISDSTPSGETLIPVVASPIFTTSGRWVAATYCIGIIEKMPATITVAKNMVVNGLVFIFFILVLHRSPYYLRRML